MNFFLFAKKNKPSTKSVPPADDIEPWMIWGYYVSPMMYGQNAIVMNEFLDDRWSTVRSLCFDKILVHYVYIFYPLVSIC